MEWFAAQNAILQALLATMSAWALAAVGATLVFAFRSVEEAVLDAMTGFATGVMVAIGFRSLLAPAIEIAAARGGAEWVAPAVGFAFGGAFLAILDRVLPHLHIGLPREEAEGIGTPWKRSVLLVLANALHNVPEGLAMGVVFGAVASGSRSVSLGGAVALAVGIGVQNVPEGATVSLTLRREGMRSRRAFWYGQLSGVAQPVVGVLAAVAVVAIRPLLPYALAFAAGAMIFVVVEELASVARLSKRADVVAVFALAGLTAMMILDVAFG